MKVYVYFDYMKENEEPLHQLCAKRRSVLHYKEIEILVYSDNLRMYLFSKFNEKDTFYPYI